MIKMHILILEDNQERINFFNKIYSKHALYITANIDEALSFANAIELDIMMLDHDLEKENFKALKEGRTGYDFCKLLVNNKLQKQSICYVHSMNPVGANAMVNLLQNNGYEAQWVPFHLLKVEERNGE